MSFQYANAPDPRKRSLLTERLPRFVTFTHPVLIFKALRCEFTLMVAIKTQFCRSPDLFLQYFLWHWELYGSRGLNLSKEHISRNVLSTERLLKYMPHKHNCLVRLFLNMLTCYLAFTAQTPKAMIQKSIYLRLFCGFYLSELSITDIQK